MGKERNRPGERKEQDDNRKEKKKEQKGGDHEGAEQGVVRMERKTGLKTDNF
jgi:hypothetical protein